MKASFPNILIRLDNPGTSAFGKSFKFGRLAFGTLGCALSLKQCYKDMLIQTEASSNHAKRLFCIIVFSKGTSLCFQICLIFPRWETTRVEAAWNGLPLTRNPF